MQNSPAVAPGLVNDFADDCRLESTGSSKGTRRPSSLSRIHRQNSNGFDKAACMATETTDAYENWQCYLRQVHRRQRQSSYEDLIEEDHVDEAEEKHMQLLPPNFALRRPSMNEALQSNQGQNGLLSMTTTSTFEGTTDGQ